MRVLGKPDIDDSVRYDELEMLLQNFGVQNSSEYPDSEHPKTATFKEEDIEIEHHLDIPEDSEIAEEVVFIEEFPQHIYGKASLIMGCISTERLVWFCNLFNCDQVSNK
jgi:hypothetical protein